MYIIADHPDLSQNDSTLVTSAITAGATSTTVRNTTGFTANAYFVAENIGSEKAEIVQVTTLGSGNNTINNTAYKYDHSVDTPLTIINYNQVKFYKSSSETGTFSYLATVNLRVDYPTGTPYNDATGLTTDWYKTSFYNSYTGTESPLSDAFPASGIYDYSVQGLWLGLITQANDPNLERLQYNDFLRWLNQIYRKMQQEVRKADIQYGLKDSGALSFTSGQETYDLSTILNNPLQVFRVWVSPGGGSNYYEALPLDLRDDNPNFVYSPYLPRYYFIDKSIGFKPTPTTGSYRILYYPGPTLLTSQGDVLPQPYRDYPDLFIDYCMYRFAQIHKPNEVAMYKAEVVERMNNFREDIVSRQIQYPQFVRNINPELMMSRDEDII